MSTRNVCNRFGHFIFGNTRGFDGRLSFFGMPGGSLRRTVTTATEEKSTTEKRPNDGEVNETVQSVQELSKQLKVLTEEKTSFEDKYKRALAEAENTRRIKIAEIEKAKNFAIQGFCKDLIEVADTLHKATECVPKEEISEDKNPHLKNLYDGLVLTENVLQKVFKKHGLVQVNPINETFDPNFHEALFQQGKPPQTFKVPMLILPLATNAVRRDSLFTATFSWKVIALTIYSCHKHCRGFSWISPSGLSEVEGKPPNEVVVVSKIGYTLNGRCIRPALVAVSKHKST